MECPLSLKRISRVILDHPKSAEIDYKNNNKKTTCGQSAQFGARWSPQLTPPYKIVFSIFSVTSQSSHNIRRSLWLQEWTALLGLFSPGRVGRGGGRGGSIYFSISDPSWYDQYVPRPEEIDPFFAPPCRFLALPLPADIQLSLLCQLYLTE